MMSERVREEVNGNAGTQDNLSFTLQVLHPLTLGEDFFETHNRCLLLFSEDKVAAK